MKRGKLHSRCFGTGDWNQRSLPNKSLDIFSIWSHQVQASKCFSTPGQIQLKLGKVTLQQLLLDWVFFVIIYLLTFIGNACGMVLGTAMLSLSWNISTIGWITLKFGTDVDVHHGTKCNNVGDPLTFHLALPSSQNIHLSNTFIYDLILAKHTQLRW